MKKSMHVFVNILLVLLTSISSGTAFAYGNITGGLGVTIDLPAGSYPRILTVEQGFPAERVGLQPNDLIVAVNGLNMGRSSLEEVFAALKGTPGTRCSLLIIRGGEQYQVSFVRQRLYPDWASGKVDHFFHIRAAEKIGFWYPEPGFVFVHPGTGDLHTVWQAGQQHPYHKVIAAATPLEWVPMPGYRFISRNSLTTVWTPGIVLDNQHIVSGEQPETWHAAPGYKFVSNNSLRVVPADDPWSDTIIGTVELIIGGWLEDTFGDNFVSDYLLSKAWAHGKNVIRYVVAH